MILDGKKIAEQIEIETKQEISGIKGRPPTLAVILIGENPASDIYVRRKTAACSRVGIRSIQKQFPSSLSAESLLHEIAQLNADSEVDGILVQLPLPSHINPTLIMESIRPDKDVDGFHPLNMGKLLIGDPSGFCPCTPLGIKVLLERSRIEVTGKHAVIIGRSNIVGKPMAAMLMQRTPGANATVTVVHSQSNNLVSLCQMADILIVAIGQPAFLKASMVKHGAVVIDVGINKMPGSKSQIVGDVDFEDVKGKCRAITPVPGGVGPMTIAMLLNNTLLSYRRRS